MKNMKPFLAILVVTAALSGCKNVKEELGVGRHSPDEFTVVKRAPLTLPPDYGLRPPEEGSIPPASVISNQAKAALMGQSAEPAPKGSAEKQFLDKLGASNADPSIRAVISEENGVIALENQSVADKLIFWEGEAEAQQKMPASVVDPKKETDRLQKNKEEGKPVNEGDVPVIEKKQGTIDKIF